MLRTTLKVIFSILRFFLHPQIPDFQILSKPYINGNIIYSSLRRCTHLRLVWCSRVTQTIAQPEVTEHVHCAWRQSPGSDAVRVRGGGRGWTGWQTGSRWNQSRDRWGWWRSVHLCLELQRRLHVCVSLQHHLVLVFIIIIIMKHPRAEWITGIQICEPAQWGMLPRSYCVYYSCCCFESLHGSFYDPMIHMHEIIICMTALCYCIWSVLLSNRTQRTRTSCHRWFRAAARRLAEAAMTPSLPVTSPDAFAFRSNA